MNWETERRDDVVVRTGADVQIDEGLRKYMLQVYNYMTVGLLITTFVSYALAHSSLAGIFFMPNAQLTVLGWVAVLSPFVLIFMMSSAVANGNAGKALVLFCLFSGLMGVSLTTIFWVYSTMSVVKTFLITAGTFAGMSLYGYTTGRDLTKFGSFLFMGLWGLILATIVNFFVKSSSFDLTLSVIGVLLFVGLTAYDTWKIRRIYNENDSENVLASKAIFGAVDLYLDFINLFLYLLRFFGSRRD